MPSGWRHYDIPQTMKLPLRNGVFQNNRNDSLQAANIGWGVLSFLTLNSLFPTPPFMSNIRRERIFSLSQNFREKLGRFYKGEEKYCGGSGSVALVGRGNSRTHPCSGLKLHIHRLALSTDHVRKKLAGLGGVLLCTSGNKRTM